MRAHGSRRKMWAGVAAAAALLVMALPAQSAKLDLEGTSWFVSGTEVIRVRRVGRDSDSTALDIDVSANNAFSAVDEHAVTYTGTVLQRGRRGTRVVIQDDAASRTKAEGAFAEWVEDMLADKGEFVTVSVVITRYRVRGVIRRGGTYLVLRSTFRFRATDDQGRGTRGTMRQVRRGSLQ